MAEVKKAVMVFNYAEKIKTSLIVASRLLEFLDGMEESAEAVGAEKLLVAYFNALILETNIAANASQMERFGDIASKLEEAVEQMKQHNYGNVQRLVSEDILRGLAILMMIGGNLPAVLYIEYYPFWLVLCNAWAAPLFIVISGMMVAFTTQTKGHRLKYFLARGTLLIIVGLLIEVFMLGGYPFMFFQILYLIGVSLPIAYLFSHLSAIPRWLTVTIFFLSHPLL